MEYTERTKAEQIANAYFDMGAGWSASGGLLKELREMEDGYIKQLADAQATIAAHEATILKMGENAAVVAKDAMAAKEQVAALQARVKELEARQHFGACAKCLTNAWRICKEGTPDAVEMKCSNGSTWWLCDYCLSKEQLTQRTAELEAVFNFVGVKYDAESKTWVSGQAPHLSAGTTKQEACIAAVDALRLACVTWETKYRDLQAELERVRGELATYKEARQ